MEEEILSPPSNVPNFYVDSIEEELGDDKGLV